MLNRSEKKVDYNFGNNQFPLVQLKLLKKNIMTKLPNKQNLRIFGVRTHGKLASDSLMVKNTSPPGVGMGIVIKKLFQNDRFSY